MNKIRTLAKAATEEPAFSNSPARLIDVQDNLMAFHRSPLLAVKNDERRSEGNDSTGVLPSTLYTAGTEHQELFSCKLIATAGYNGSITIATSDMLEIWAPVAFAAGVCS
jgi:hypothetical protein